MKVSGSGFRSPEMKKKLVQGTFLDEAILRGEASLQLSHSSTCCCCSVVFTLGTPSPEPNPKLPC